jgi:hypothetical protein
MKFFSLFAAAGVASLAFVSTAAAAENSALTAIRDFCMPAHGDGAKAIAAAQAAGWSEPSMGLPGNMADYIRTNRIGGGIQTFGIKIPHTQNLPSGAVVQVVGCDVRNRPPTSDITADFKTFLGHAPTGGTEWRYVEAGGKRRFLPDLSPDALEAALHDGPVTILDAHNGQEASEVNLTIMSLVKH